MAGKSHNHGPLTVEAWGWDDSVIVSPSHDKRRPRRGCWFRDGSLPQRRGAWLLLADRQPRSVQSERRLRPVDPGPDRPAPPLSPLFPWWGAETGTAVAGARRRLRRRPVLAHRGRSRTTRRRNPMDCPTRPAVATAPSREALACARRFQEPPGGGRSTRTGAQRFSTSSTIDAISPRGGCGNRCSVTRADLARERRSGTLLPLTCVPRGDYLRQLGLLALPVTPDA